MENSCSLLAVSGSLRSQSANTAILKAMAEVAPPGVQIYLYDGIGNLPFFNPETEQKTAMVQDFRKAIQESDGIIICTPEYAFGIPGVLKNALDWLVGSGEINGKPVAAISASPLPTGGDKALLSLENTLTALGTVKSEKTILKIPFILKKLSADSLLTDETTKQQLKDVLQALIAMIAERRYNITD